MKGRGEDVTAVQAMREKLQEIKDAMDDTRKALHEAVTTFREANPRP